MRPRKINSVEELRACCTAYFRQQDELERPYTMSGLARHCGFKSVGAFKTYTDEDNAYQEVLDEARLRCIERAEEGCYTLRNSSGVQFLLKAMDSTYNTSSNVDINANMHHSVEGMLLDVENEDLGSGM